MLGCYENFDLSSVDYISIFDVADSFTSSPHTQDSSFKNDQERSDGVCLPVPPKSFVGNKP